MCSNRVKNLTKICGFNSQTVTSAGQFQNYILPTKNFVYEFMIVKLSFKYKNIKKTYILYFAWIEWRAIFFKFSTSVDALMWKSSVLNCSWTNHCTPH